MIAIDALILSCEHGGNQVPPAHRRLFAPHGRLLRSHRAFDPGALDMARFLARRTDAALFASTTTRLLVDLNRSPTNPRVFSEVTRPLDGTTRRELLEGCHAPHWSTVERALRSHVHAGRTVLHVGIHSFTPVLRGVRRAFDLGILYDPQRKAERLLCATWCSNLRGSSPRLRVRRNHPYRGSADGLTTAMRKRFAARRYLGIELEINQKWWHRNDPEVWRGVRRLVLETLCATIKARGHSGPSNVRQGRTRA